MNTTKNVGNSLFKQTRETEDGQTVQLNKGHYSLDTLERLNRFTELLGQGWEEDYQDYRRLWVDLPTKKEIRDYPLLVDIELASACNLSCPMCYTISDEFKAKVTKGLMDFDIFKKIIDEIKDKVYSVRLSFRGESTLHRHFIECIEYAKNAGIKEVATLTNGWRLKGDYLRKVVDAGIDWITVSIDGVGETYESIRKPIKFEEIVSNLTELAELKKRENLTRPLVKVQGIWPAVKKDPETYYQIFSKISDLVAFNPLIDYLRNDSDVVFEDRFSCPQLYQRLVIGSDGKVMMCSNDEDGEEIVGDMYTQSIHEIWHGDELNRIRKTHAELDGFKCMGVCKKCYYPRKTEPNESVMVDGRKVIVENYINRTQQIGS